jgi:hypothetical protein
MDAASGVHLHPLTRGNFVLNLSGQRIDFMGVIFDRLYALAFVKSNLDGLAKSQF